MRNRRRIKPSVTSTSSVSTLDHFPASPHYVVKALPKVGDLGNYDRHLYSNAKQRYSLCGDVCRGSGQGSELRKLALRSLKRDLRASCPALSQEKGSNALPTTTKASGGSSFKWLRFEYPLSPPSALPECLRAVCRKQLARPNTPS